MRIAIVLAATMLAASVAMATPFPTATMQPVSEVASQSGISPILSGAPAPNRSDFTSTEPIVLSIKMWTDGGLLVRGPESGTLKVLATEGLRVLESDGKLTVAPGSANSGLVAAIYTTPEGGIWVYAFRVTF